MGAPRDRRWREWIAAMVLMAAAAMPGGVYMFVMGAVEGHAFKLLLGAVLAGFGAYVGFVSLPAEWRKPTYPIGKSPGGPTRSERTSGLVGLWCLALFFLLLGLPWGFTIIQRAIGPEGSIVLIELLFLPIPAVLLLAYAIVLTRRHRRASRPISHA